MDTKKSLTRHYVHLSNWKCEYRQSVIKFLDDALSFFDGGAAELDVPYRSHDEADAADEDFDEQFPASVYIEDRHGFQHEVYVTRLYKRNDLYYVDGFDNTDDVWITGWYTSSDTATYDTLAYFIDAVLNPADDDAVPLADGSIFSGGFTSQLVGYQLVDDVDSYPAGWARLTFSVHPQMPGRCATSSLTRQSGSSLRCGPHLTCRPVVTRCTP